MPPPPPFRQRPNLHLAIRSLTGSPIQNAPSRSFSTPTSSSLPTPTGTPLGTTAYSPFRSAGLKPPTPHGRAMSPKPRRLRRRTWGKYDWMRPKRLLSNRFLWAFVMALCLTLWWWKGGRPGVEQVRLGAEELSREYISGKRMQDYQFFPASNPKIHVRGSVRDMEMTLSVNLKQFTGRWTSTPNRLRRDGTFPGVYFDARVTNTTTFLLSLHNSIDAGTDGPNSSSISSLPDPGHFSFRPISTAVRPSPPVSLLARVDDEEYVLLPNASSLVTVCLDSLDRHREHHIRIVAPMADDYGQGVVELEGVWLSKSGRLSKVAGSSLSEDYMEEDLFEAENDLIGEKHRTGLMSIDNGGVSRSSMRETAQDLEETIQAGQERRKVLEIVTDSPGLLNSKDQGKRTRGSEGLLTGVMGWEYLLGEMFSADHIGIGVEGMCLTQDCIGGIGYPAGIGDVFFRSGPYGSEYFEHSWAFSTYIPDVLVLNLGDADHRSFEAHHQEYDKSYFDLSARFEATYISLISGIRRLAYPKHPAIAHSERFGSPGVIPANVPAAIPIFVMRPFRGQLEQATQNVVAKLRADGDKAVFWLDTSGWLDQSPESADFVSHESAGSNAPPSWRLTEQGNQRVAIFLHVHVCRYLAEFADKCPFLPQEVYQGKIFDPEEANFNRYLENEKERRLKQLFWDGGGEESKAAAATAVAPAFPSTSVTVSASSPG